jgi:GR25 family glycosyltransferase involved in LPS biosynthesis
MSGTSKSNYTYQFIVINANNERKQLMQKQFDMLKEDLNIYYLDASTPSNSQDYLNGFSNDNYNDKKSGNFSFEMICKTACCFRSHIRALDYASKSNFDFSIILEDDVAFYKENFLKLLNELFCNWNEYDTHKMVSIGWVPMHNYEIYFKQQSKYTKLKSVPGTTIHPLLHCGFQGYIVKNNDIHYLDYLVQPTLIDLYNKLNSVEFKSIFKTISFVFETPVDSYLNFLFNQIFVFPPLVIERDIPSLLDHNNINHYWSKYFQNYESEREKYMYDI